MEYVHRCPLCGWHRPAAGAAMLAPRCERCGGLLEALTAEEHAGQRARGAREQARLASRALSPRAARALRIARWTIAGVVAVAVARFAYGAGGAALAAGAFALAALFSLTVVFPGR